MDKLLSDSAKTENSNKDMDILRGVLSNQNHARTTRNRGVHIFSIFSSILSNHKNSRIFAHTSQFCSIKQKDERRLILFFQP